MARDIERYRGSRNPMMDLFEGSRRLNRWFDDVFNQLPLAGSLPFEESTPMLANADVEETDSHYLVSLDVPGIPRQNINIEVSGNRLMISGEKRTESGSPKGRRSERSYRHFEETVTLPTDVDASKIEANCENGVLQIAIPKGETQRRHKIEIGEGKGGFFSRLAGKVESAVGMGKEKEVSGSTPQSTAGKTTKGEKAA